jgi:hypothetical protein
MATQSKKNVISLREPWNRDVELVVQLLDLISQNLGDRSIPLLRSIGAGRSLGTSRPRSGAQWAGPLGDRPQARSRSDRGDLADRRRCDRPRTDILRGQARIDLV